MPKEPRFQPDMAAREYQKSKSWYLRKQKMVARPGAESEWAYENSEALWEWAARNTGDARETGQERAGMMLAVFRLIQESGMTAKEAIKVIAKEKDWPWQPLWVWWLQGANGEPLSGYPQSDWSAFLMSEYPQACRELIEVELARKSRTTAAVETAIDVLNQLDIELSPRHFADLVNAIYDLFEDGWSRAWRKVVSDLIVHGCNSPRSGEVECGLGKREASAIVEHHADTVFFRCLNTHGDDE